MIFTELVYNYRKFLGLNQKQFSQKIKFFDRFYLSRLESGLVGINPRFVAHLALNGSSEFSIYGQENILKTATDMVVKDFLTEVNNEIRKIKIEETKRSCEFKRGDQEALH
jgi:hypothetical protein